MIMDYESRITVQDYNKALPQSVKNILKAMPGRRGGLNNWLFKAALALHGYRTPEQIISILEEATTKEPIKTGEIERAVNRSALAKEGKLQTGRDRVSSWPNKNVEQREAIISKGGDLADLWERSPIRCDGEYPTAENVMDILFPDNPLLCCASRLERPLTRPLSEWRDFLSRQQFIVPNPMTARKGVTQDGKPSNRSLLNTGSRRFLIVEQDQGTTDEQAAVLLHLASHWPLALVCHSGGKSLHGWFYCHRQPENRIERFMRYAVSIGADPATWLRCQFVRMPEGIREDGARQQIYFFNPSLIK